MENNKLTLLERLNIFKDSFKNGILGRIWENIRPSFMGIIMIFVYSFTNITENTKNDWYTFILVCILIYYIYTSIKIMSQWEKLIKEGTIFIATTIIILSTIFCSLYVTALFNIPDSFVNINIDNYSKNLKGAIMITLDMYHYSVGNCIFGCSTINPNTTFLRCINTIQLVISYIIIIRGAVDITKNNFDLKMADLLIKNSEANNELALTIREIVTKDEKLIDEHLKIIQAYNKLVVRTEKLLGEQINADYINAEIENKTDNNCDKIARIQF